MWSYCHNCCCGCGSARDSRYQFGSLEHSHDNHSTHSVRGERVVASNKVVSTRKNACSAHVEILIVKMFKTGEGRKGERLEARRPPITPRGGRMFWSIFIYLKHVPGLFQLPSSLLLVFVFLVPRWHLRSPRQNVRVRTAANISEEFLGNEGAKYTPWTQEPRLTIL
jgi:hypothetical protein